MGLLDTIISTFSRPSERRKSTIHLLASFKRNFFAREAARAYEITRTPARREQLGDSKLHAPISISQSTKFALDNSVKPLKAFVILCPSIDR